MVLETIQGAVFGLFRILADTAVIWVSVGLLILAWHMFREYMKIKNISSKKWSLLEIRLPQEIEKTPEAMEIILGSMHQSYEGTWLTRLTQGTTRTWSSLEIVSIEGSIHFFIRVEALFKNIVESQIYAQYPTVEIYEVPDYTLYVDYTGKNPEDWKFWGMELKLKKPDPYPIKTYIDYQLDKPGGREDNRVDPLSTLLEQLGSLGPGEQGWVQILIQATKDKVKLTDWWFKKEGWKDEGEKLIEELKEKGKDTNDEGKQIGFPDRTEGQKMEIDAIERNISKIGFDCGLRFCYLAAGDAFKLPNQLGLMNAFKQFGSENLNSFKPAAGVGFNFPWQDPFGKRSEQKKRIMFNAYRKRSYFYPPYYGEKFVLNSEELATLFHFPGGLVTTPTLGRIGSKKVEPPADLPL